jgi:hypothetical protein
MKEINWNDMSELGLIVRINKEILHPLGLAMSRNPETGHSESVFIADDGVFEYAEEVDDNSISDDDIRRRITMMPETLTRKNND